MERKSGSSSRSPSLSRRPSLKDKKPISKPKKKLPPGAKKERWLLTRKTWRYMTDAVGNLLPEYRGGSSRRGSAFPQSSSPPPPELQGAGPSKQQQQQHQQHQQQQQQQQHQQQQQQQQHQQHQQQPPGVSSPPHRSPRATTSPPTSQVQFYSIHRNPSARTPVVSPTSSSAFPWGSFPSHRPGVTPTGPGPGGSSSIPPPQPKNPRHPSHPIDPEDYPAIEKHFNDVCTKEKRFLLWTRNKAKGLSGPALREQKLKKKDDEGASGVGRQASVKSLKEPGSSSKGFFHHHQLFQRNQSVDQTGNKDPSLFSPDYYSPEEEFGDEDDYDEYDNEEEQITVRERRKSSTASSTMSILGGQGMSFFRPLSTVSMSSGNSDTSYAMITLGPGVHKILRNTGIQTDPFPEELLIRLRLQAVHEDRQRQAAAAAAAGGSGGHHQPMSPPIHGSHPPTSLFPHEDSKGKETVIPISTADSIASSPKSGSERESEEKVLDKIVGRSSEGHTKGTSSGVSSLHDTSMSSNVTGTTATTSSSGGQESTGSTATTTTTTATTEDKKSEESGYSSSISDTVMRYLRMVRKNSKADNKETIDKFKTVNYDRSLRYIKSKNVTVEEALEHEKNKALGLGGSGSPTSPLPALPDLPHQQVPHNKAPAPSASGGGASATTTTTTNVPGGSVTTTTTTLTSSLIQEDSLVTRVSVSKVPVGDEGLYESPQPGPSPPSSGLPSPPPTDHHHQPQSSQQPPQKTKGKKAKGSNKDTTKAATPPLSAPAKGRKSSIPSQPAPPAPPSPGEDLSPPSSPPPPPPPKEVGIQAGESIVRLLKSFNLRKFSEVSTGTYSSESPAGEFTSPRYSIATTVLSSEANTTTDFPYLQQHQAALASMISAGFVSDTTTTTASGSGLGSGVHTTARSSFDMFSSADEMEDVFHLYQQTAQFSHQQLQSHLQHQQVLQQQEGHHRGQTSSSRNNTSTGPTDPGLSSLPGTTTYSFSQQILSQIPLSTSTPYPRHHQQHLTPHSFHATPKKHHSTPTTPVTSHSTSSSSLVKTFFSSSPFSSSFFNKTHHTSTKSPTTSSTTSLVSPRLTLGTLSSTSPNLPPPPTTSSSPNLLSLLSSSGGGCGGGRSSRERHEVKSSFGRSGVSFKGSLVPQKGQMSLPVGDTDRGEHSYLTNNPSSSSTVMQKSKSSSSVLPLYGDQQQRSPSTHSTTTTAPSSSGPASSASRLMSKSSRIFKSRSKSSTRAATSSSGSNTCAWAPQGKCKWKSPNGKTITLDATTALGLSEVERQTLQEVALDKIKALSLGVDVKIPKEKTGVPHQKPKRRPYLLKKKALSTGFFESGTKRDESKDSTNPGTGAVFGISLTQCVANDRLKGIKSAAAASPQASADLVRKRSQNGSRNSVSSVCETAKEESKGSSESLFWGKRGSVVAVEALTASGDLLGESLQPPPMSVPAIVTACVKHLENYGLHTTGIFRVSTSLKRIRQLREEIDGGKEIEFGEEHSPHDVAALLKEFLRDLPEPLLSRELYQAFLKTQKIRNRKQQLEAVQHLVQLLPVANRDTLASLLKFFAKVVANATETKTTTGEILPGNKMEGYSLATLIAPNILPCMPSEGTVTSGMDSNLTKERRESIDVVNYMISNYKLIFEISPELLHDVYLHLMDTQPETVEVLLKQKSGLLDDPMDEVETSSVFEGSECGELAELDEQATMTQAASTTTRVFRRREDILHEGAVRGSLGGSSGDGAVGGPPTSRLERTRERVRGKRESSRERMSSEQQGQSGAESDSSSTKSTSRWFRRTRGGENKTRTSSDSGSEKGKGRGMRDSSLVETKRASSLDSVNLKENAEGEGREARLSDAAQSLKVPENLSRRQSSPVLESSGVITASLKIPVPVPLNIDDTDIPFIEDDHHDPHLHAFHHHHHHGGRAGPPAVSPRSRGRSASTDSSAMARSSTPISASQRQTSSEMSSPGGMSPQGSPPYDPTTFPYEEMTARILIGAPSSAVPVSNLSTVTTSVSTSGESKSATSTPTIRPKVESNKTGPASSKVLTSVYLQPSSPAASGGASQPSTSTSPPYVPPSEPKGLGKETKGANIGGLIKSKTADFEKLAKSSSSSSTSPGVATTSTAYSIAPKMRLRSQENIVLKQQFLLRQQQAHGEGKGSSVKRSNSNKDAKDEGDRPPSSSGGQRSITRRRHLMGSASSSAILAPPDPRSPSSQPISVTVRSSNVGGGATTSTGAHQQQPPTGGTSPSRWKRSEIIASRQESHNKSSTDPETFV